MSAKRILSICAMAGLAILAAAAIRASGPPAAAEGPQVMPQAASQANIPLQPERNDPMAAPDVSETAVGGSVLEQTFLLTAGWNAIYFGVEPLNGSPVGSDGVPSQSVMEWVFGGLGDKLDSVWTYNQPVSSRDYLIDPGDGLWDEAGWLRFIPESNTGPDGASRAFLTNLYTLHANTGYLVKMNASGEVAVRGKPVPGHQRWTPGAYNLSGFPLGAGGIALGVFATGSPIEEVRGLTTTGNWTLPLAPGDTLLPGVAYLVKYGATPDDPDFTAPLDVGASEEAMILSSDGLEFGAGLSANTTALRLENLSATPCDAIVSVPADSAVKLQYVSDAEPPGEPIDLRGAGTSIAVAPYAVAWVILRVPVEQLTAGETLLQISCAAVGTRWLIPVSAEPRSLAGLWVGDVVVNDVSEARLGATDAAHDLTVALATQSDSGVRGAAEIHEKLVGQSSTLQISITLALPEETAAVLPRILALNLLSSPTQETWTSLSGSLAGGFVLGLDGSTDYQYLNVRDVVANKILKDGLHPFVLSTAGLQPAFYSYWDAQGVNASAVAGTWQAWMYQIIIGNEPVFYLKVSDSGATYRLIDGLMWDFYSTEEYLRVRGDYPAGGYSYAGILSDTEGRVSGMALSITFTELPPVPPGSPASATGKAAGTRLPGSAAAGSAISRDSAAVPDATDAAVLHVAGYVFVDANQNGQHDATEVGLAGVQVTLTGFGTQTTGADGGYLFNNVPAGAYSLASATPAGYTSEFSVTVPAGELDAAPVAAPNEVPATVTLAVNQGATAVTPEAYLAQILPEPDGYPATPYLPYFDTYDNRVEPLLNFGLVRADRAVLRAGLCGSASALDLAQLGIVKNGTLVTTYPGPLAALLGDAHIYIERKGVGVACGNLVIGAPTAFDDGRGSTARFRILLRVKASGQTELLPYYEMDAQQRVSAANFLSLQKPKAIPGPFGVVAQGLEFDLSLPAEDPLNPFKHKYNPDHDNLDRKFQEYGEDVPLYLYESYAVDRRVTLSLTALPPGVDDAAEVTLDWGGTTWGGDYREVIEGLHQNTITVRGYFVIRRALSADQLVAQDYDK